MRKLKPREALTLLFPHVALRIPFLLFVKIKSLKNWPRVKKTVFISKLYNNSFHKGKCQTPCTVHAPYDLLLLLSYSSLIHPLLLLLSLTPLASSFSSSLWPLNCCFLYLETNSPIYIHHEPPSNPCPNVTFSMRSSPPPLNATTYHLHQHPQAPLSSLFYHQVHPDARRTVPSTY